jgi:hypothetical protein
MWERLKAEVVTATCGLASEDAGGRVHTRCAISLRTHAATRASHHHATTYLDALPTSRLRAGRRDAPLLSPSAPLPPPDPAPTPMAAMPPGPTPLPLPLPPPPTLLLPPPPLLEAPAPKPAPASLLLPVSMLPKDAALVRKGEGAPWLASDGAAQQHRAPSIKPKQKHLQTLAQGPFPRPKNSPAHAAEQQGPQAIPRGTCCQFNSDSVAPLARASRAAVNWRFSSVRSRVRSSIAPARCICITPASRGAPKQTRVVDNKDNNAAAHTRPARV